MLVMQQGQISIEHSGSIGWGQASTYVQFPGMLIRSATAVLCGFKVTYGFEIDRHVGEVGALVSGGVIGDQVLVSGSLALFDESSDDPFSGWIDYCVIADVLELPATDPLVEATGVLTES